jgi:N-ethylmaleimide reductase
MPEALGYPRIPGIFNEAQVEGWKKTTDKVHADGSKIFLQLMHTGRIGHNDNLPDGVSLVGASAKKAAGQIYTDTAGMQDHSEPTVLSSEDIKGIIDGYVSAAKNAMAAGFDGVELHAANGYLLEQFLNPNVNDLADQYGGNIVNRARLVVEVATQVAYAIGNDKVGIRFSPFSTLGDLQAYDAEEVHQTYAYLAKEMYRLAIQYIHISANPGIPQKTFDAIRSNFFNTIIFCNGLTAETAEVALQNGFADLVAFGRSFLATPDFVSRIETGEALNTLDFTTLYTPGEKGYTDYPSHQLTSIA